MWRFRDSPKILFSSFRGFFLFARPALLRLKSLSQKLSFNMISRLLATSFFKIVMQKLGKYKVTWAMLNKPLFLLVNCVTYCQVAEPNLLERWDLDWKEGSWNETFSELKMRKLKPFIIKRSLLHKVYIHLAFRKYTLYWR